MGRLKKETVADWPEGSARIAAATGPGAAGARWAARSTAHPTARHAADLGFLPVLLEDACGAGHPEAAARSIESLRFAGDTLFSDVENFGRLLAAQTPSGAR